MLADVCNRRARARNAARAPATVSHVADLQRRAADAPHPLLRPVARASAALTGADGTLEERAENASSRVRAKTGLLTRVTALSGFAQRGSGERVVFSLLVNGFRGSAEQAMDAVDGFVEVLAGE